MPENAIEHAKDHGNDIVILDTAGRLHIDEELMNELKRHESIGRSALKFCLVVDAMTGQDAVNVAKSFDEALGIDGVILTKAGRRYPRRCGAFGAGGYGKTGKVCRYRVKSWMILEPFHPERMASRILGMGDVLTLIEKAQTTIDEKEARRNGADKLKENSFDMNDLLEQMSPDQKNGAAEADYVDDSRRGRISLRMLTLTISS